MGEGSLRLRPCLNELGAGAGELQNHWSASCLKRKVAGMVY